MRRQEGRSVARRSVVRRNAELIPRLSGLRSLSIVRSQDWRGRPLGRRQSTRRWSVDARSAREWSSEAAAQPICPNSLRRRCCISEETGGLVGLWPYRYVSNVCRIWDAKNTSDLWLPVCVNTQESARQSLQQWHSGLTGTGGRRVLVLLLLLFAGIHAKKASQRLLCQRDGLGWFERELVQRYICGPKEM